MRLSNIAETKIKYYDGPTNPNNLSVDDAITLLKVQNAINESTVVTTNLSGLSKQGEENELTKYATEKQFHIVRSDILTQLKEALKSGDKVLIEYLKEHFPNDAYKIFNETRTDNLLAIRYLLENVCVYGFNTSKGFFRKTQLEENGFALRARSSLWDIYEK